MGIDQNLVSTGCAEIKLLKHAFDIACVDIAGVDMGRIDSVQFTKFRLSRSCAAAAVRTGFDWSDMLQLCRFKAHAEPDAVQLLRQAPDALMGARLGANSSKWCRLFG